MFESGQFDHLTVGSEQQGINKTETSQLSLPEYLQPNDPTDHLSVIAVSLPLPIFIYTVYYVIQVFWSFAIKLMQI